MSQTAQNPARLSQLVQKLTLANGATLMYLHRSDAPRSALNVYIPGGNRVEKITGETDLIGELLYKGTPTRTAEQIAIALDSLTLSLDVDTRRDYAVASATFMEDDMEGCLSVMADLLLNSTLESFEKEKFRMLGEFRMDLDSPRSRASDGLVRAMFGNTPYRAVGSVLLESLDKITSLDVLRKCYQSIYHPARFLYVYVGPMLPEQIQPLLEKEFASSLPLVEVDENRFTSPTLEKDLLITHPKEDSNQAHIFKAWYAPANASPDYAAMVVMNTILGGAGLSSRLFTELRDKKGLAYNVRSQYEAYLCSGMFSLYIGCEPSKKPASLAGFIEECDRLVNEPVPEWELAEAKNNVLGRRALYLETASQQCGYIGANIILGKTLKELDEQADRIRAITSADVQRISEQLFSQPSALSIVAPSSAL